MPSNLRTALGLRFAIVFVLLTFGGSAFAQEVTLAMLSSEAITAAPAPLEYRPITLPEASSHHFWDRENTVLFATNAAFSGADFYLTRSNLCSGGREFNPVTSMFGSSTAGLAMNFAGETVGVVGISYLFHKTGHHKLERFVSMVNLGSSATAVSFDLAHR
jgi:hypothetical protein